MQKRNVAYHHNAVVLKVPTSANRQKFKELLKKRWIMKA
jgi:hypothetical protein